MLAKAPGLTMNKSKVILLLLAIFLLAITLAFYYENNYRILVRFFFSLFQGDQIKFSGKDFHLFASYSFVIGFGLYCSLQTLLLYRKNHTRRLIELSTSILLFFITTTMTTFADSLQMVAKCTAC